MMHETGQADVVSPNHTNQNDELGINVDEGEWVDAGEEYMLVDYTKIQELIQTFRT